MPSQKPTAIVIPWFGRDLKGGAEQQAFQLATRLADAGEKVEVLTTCSPAFNKDWGKNELVRGEERITAPAAVVGNEIDEPLARRGEDIALDRIDRMY